MFLRKRAPCRLGVAVALALWPLAIFPLNTGEPEVVFKQVGMGEGLSQSSVFAILQDRKGFLWFGTANGLNRYDGYGFTVFRHDPERPESIGNDSVRAMIEDRHGILWVGTEGGLSRLRFNAADEPVFHNFKHDPNRENSLIHDRIMSLWEDRQGMIWIGSRKGLCRWDPASETFTRYTWNPNHAIAVPEVRIRAILEDRAGDLWVGTPYGLFRINAERTETRVYAVFPDEKRASYAPHIQSWFGTPGPEKLILGITQVGNGQSLAEDFEVRKATHALVMATGEAGEAPENFGGMASDGSTGDTGEALVDFGGIASGEEVIWRMELEKTRYGGGALKNRIQMGVVHLPPGAYSMFYQSNHQHAYGNWDDIPPESGEHWGIRLFSLVESQVKALQDGLALTHLTPQLFTDDIASLYEDSHGDLWVATCCGLNLLEKTSRSILTYGREGKDRYSRPCGQSPVRTFVRDMTEDRDGRLWFTTLKGLFRFDPRSGFWEHFRQDHQKPQGLNTDNIGPILVDRAGSLWLGTVMAGILNYDPRRPAFANFLHKPLDPHGLPSPIVHTFTEEGERYLWVGTAAGLGLFDLQQRQGMGFDERMREALAGETVWTMAKDYEGYLWVGGEFAGLVRFHPALLPEGKDSLEDKAVQPRNLITRFNPSELVDQCYRLYLDGSKELWAGGGNGLGRFQHDTQSFAWFKHDPEDPTSLGPGIVWAIHQDRTRKLWVGLYGGGISRKAYFSDDFTHFRHEPGNPNSLSQNQVTAFLEDDEGDLWVGTYGGGLNRYVRARGNFVRYLEEDGLPNNVIYAILQDARGYLWLSSNQGLIRFHPGDGHFLSYGIDDGLQSPEFNLGAALGMSDGRLVFGGVKGFNVFDPNLIREGSTPPPIAITGVSNLQGSIPFTSALAENRPIQLSHRDKAVAFDFAMLDFARPQKNRFAYRLVGFDEDWIAAGNRSMARYTNLDPGRYLFRVKGTNSEGIRNEYGVSLGISIEPPFWRKPWFNAVVLYFGLGMVMIIHRWRIETLRRRHFQQERLAKQLLHTQEQERRRIAGELHDSLGQNLLLIHHEVQKGATPEGPDSKPAELSQKVLDLLEEVRHIAYNLHPHQLDRLGLAKALEEVVTRVSKAVQLDIALWCDPIDGLLGKDGEIHLYRIIQEALNNIAKHAEAKHAWVEVLLDGHWLSVRIADDGKGFASNSGGKPGLGLAGMCERTTLMGGSFDIHPLPNQGTQILLKIPLVEEVNHGTRNQRARG